MVLKVQNSDRYEKSSAFERFLGYSDEKQKILSCIIKTFHPKKSWNLLDVGAGNGDLTVPLSKYFKSTTTVEPSTLMIKALK
jgi:16S rRNA A1518/A1519 N6-dimethyltransferase RsmA/KsgA/DIM1 with predicted DNA glycosylase/AP lyase activity